MLGLFKTDKQEKPEEWMLLATISTDVLWNPVDPTVFDNEKDLEGSIYLHFYESTKGRRGIHVTASGRGAKNADRMQLQDYVKTTPEYSERWYRWLQGMPDPNIPNQGDLINQFTAERIQKEIIRPLNVYNLTDAGFIDMVEE